MPPCASLWEFGPKNINLDFVRKKPEIFGVSKMG